MHLPSLAGFLLAGLACQQAGQAVAPPAAAEKARAPKWVPTIR